MQKGERHMKRKIVKIMVAVIAVGALLVGCDSTETTIDKEIVEKVEESDEVTEEEAEEVAEESVLETVTIEETVLLDENGIKITAIGLEDGWFGTDLKLLIENNGDKNVTVQARNSSVNGFMVDTMMSEDVVAGKKANTTLTFSTGGLKEANITTVANMEFAFHIFETDSWDTYLDSAMIVLETSAADGYEQAVDDSGTVFYDTDGIKIVGKGLSTDDSIFGLGLIVYIENNTEKNITVQVRDTSVNGFMVDPSMSQDVVSGKKAISAVTFFSSDLEGNGIEDITEIETSFHIFDMDSWDGIADTEAIVINF